MNAGSNALPISEQILLQDYYAPSHTLFVSMYYDMIDPVEVIKSNVCNAILGVHYPPLTNTIVARVKGETLERGVGWSYHFFVQGYNFMGFMGFLYNVCPSYILCYIGNEKSDGAIYSKYLFEFYSRDDLFDLGDEFPY